MNEVFGAGFGQRSSSKIQNHLKFAGYIISSIIQSEIGVLLLEINHLKGSSPFFICIHMRASNITHINVA